MTLQELFEVLSNWTPVMIFEGEDPHTPYVQYTPAKPFRENPAYKERGYLLQMPAALAEKRICEQDLDLMAGKVASVDLCRGREYLMIFVTRGKGDGELSPFMKSFYDTIVKAVGNGESH